MRLLRLLLRVVLVLLVVAGTASVFVIAGLPSRDQVRSLARKNPERTSLMRQREAEAQAAGRKPRRLQSWVPLARVSRNLIHAVIASEDQRFFGHAGVDWDAVRDSAETDLKRGRLARGGSTITQQLAKNLFFTTDKHLVRKLREMVVTTWLEDDLSKKRILELYLNVIEWGDSVYGCEAAAKRYYGKPASDLDVDEAAGLAAMIPSPRRINPRVSPRLHAQAVKRVLWLMAGAGYLGRQAAGLGSEPPAPVVPDEGPEPTEPVEPAPSAEPMPTAGR